MKPLSLIIACVFLLVPRSAIAALQPTALQVRGDRLSGVVLPMLPRASDVKINALRADAWTIDDTKRLLLNEDIIVSIGGFAFEAEKAVCWINRFDTDAGTVSQIVVYLPSFSKTSRVQSMSAEGKNLLVYGSTLGAVTLDVALLQKNAKAKEQSLNRTAEGRLEGFIAGLLQEPQQLTNHPQVVVTESSAIDEFDETITVELPKGNQPWLKSEESFISLGADAVELQTSDIENTITLNGNVQLALHSPESNENLDMSATNGVIFMSPGSVRDIASGEIDTTNILGIYLEGNVVIHAAYSQYLVRAPQMYYDFTTGKATMVEAVLRTYIKEGRMPLYIRADELKQIAENAWVGNGIQASTSSFATPDLAIGSETMEITQDANGDTYIKSEGNELRLGGTPIMYWPTYEGKAGKIPLRRVRLSGSNQRGVAIETRWDLYTLLGKDSPAEVSANLNIDGYSKRGVGAGLDFEYNVNKNVGTLDLYLLSDSGTEKTSSGRRINVDTSERGYALWKNSVRPTENWLLQMQASYISDDTFISSWRREEYRTELEYETSFYAKYQEDTSAFTMLAKDNINAFISNDWLLASRQYTVDKLPEIGFFNYGTSFLDGHLSWSTELRFMRERMQFQPGTPRSVGLRAAAFAFPDGTLLANTQQIDAPLISQGLNTQYQTRFVTRQELAMPFNVGAFQLTPFASIQATFGIDEDNAASNSDDPYVRSVGIRASTQLQRVYNDVESELLDLHRLRHVIEPYATIWNAESNIDPMALQQYDGFIDNLSVGTAMWVGVRNRLQTYRGGPGRWYEVDWLSIDTAFIFANDGATQRYDNPQFFDWRPELSSIRDAAIATGKWEYSDSVTFIGQGTWELDGGTFSRGSIGAEIDHGRDMRTYIEYRELAVSDDQYLTLGMRYNLNKRYSFFFRPSWNFRIDDFQSLGLNITRHYPEFDLIGRVSYNAIQDETRYGLRMNLKKY